MQPFTRRRGGPLRLPARSLLFDEVGRGTTERNLCPGCDPLEDFRRRRTGHFSLEDLLDVVGEVLASSTCAPCELSMQTIGNVSHLDHL